MRDAVTDLLEERAGSAPHLSAWAVASLALHLAIVTPLIAAATRPPSRDIRPVRVRLTSPRIAQPAPVTPAPAVKPAPKPEPPKPATKQVDKSLFGKSPEKPVEKAPPVTERAAPSTTPPAPPSTATNAPALPESGASLTSSFDGTFPYPLYVDRMLGLIADHWFRPQSQPARPVTVHFVIDRNGRASDVEVSSSSGLSGFDRAAKRAVLDAQPFPPLPFDYVGTDLGVYLEFK